MPLSGRALTHTKEVESRRTGMLFDEVSEDAVIEVFRRDDRTKRLVFSFWLAPHEASEQTIQDVRGGGTYLCKELVPDEEKGIRVVGRQRTIEVEGPPKVLTEERMGKLSRYKELQGVAGGQQQQQQATQIPTVATQIGDAMATGMTAIVQSMQNQNKAQAEFMQVMLAQIQANANRAPMDWGAIITAVVPLVQSMVEGRKETGQSVGPTDVMNMGLELAKVVQDAQSKRSSISEIVTAINEMMDLKDRVSGPPEDADPVMYLARTQLPKIIEYITSQTRRGHTPTADEVQRRFLPEGTHVGGDGMWAQIKQWESSLAGFASRGVSAEEIADHIMHTTPQEIKAALRNLLSRDDAAEQVFARLPALRSHQEWTTRLFGRLEHHFFGGDGGTQGESGTVSEQAPARPDDDRFGPSAHAGRPGGTPGA